MILKKWKALLNKVHTIFGSSQSPKAVTKELANLALYAFGQALAYSGIGGRIPFSVNGYKLYLSKSPVAMVLFGNRKLVREEELFAESFLNHGDIVLDIGANIGNLSLCASRLVGSMGHVYAFEAHPKTALYARRNILLNKVKNIKLFSFALGEADGEIRFSTGPYDDVNHVDTKGNIIVAVRPLDTIGEISSLEKITLIKIDVEGYELPVLKGALETLKKTGNIYFEVFEEQTLRYGYSAEELFSFLEERGFSIVSPESSKPLLLKDLPRNRITNCLATRA